MLSCFLLHRRLRALLIQEGVKPARERHRLDQSLRALLIQEGVKLTQLKRSVDPCLRALLIQEGVKHVSNTIDSLTV